MTVNAVRRRTKVAKLRDDPLDQPPPMAIGEIDANIVDCPVCRRPLDTSARRCPGCRTRFVSGVQASKASVFVAFGLAVGLMTGGGVVAVAVPKTTVLPAPTTAPIATVAPAPTTAPVPTVAPTAPPVNSGIPAAATAALRGTVTVNSRISVVAAPLAAELAARNFDTQAVAQVMRRLAFEATAAEALLPSLASWPAASAVQADLTAFYADVRGIAIETLGSSVRNQAAYETGARAMVERLQTLASLDQASRELAGTVGVELPPAGAAP